MARVDENYWDFVQMILSQGKLSDDRTGVGTKRIFGTQFRHDFDDGFPILSMRKQFTKGVWGELAAFVRGAREIEDFRKFGCNYWDMNLAAFNQGAGTPDRTDLGPIYGATWRDFEGVDQLGTLLNTIKNKPGDRRQIVSAWMPHRMGEMVLPPCHIMFQTFVEDGKLSMSIYQRSLDTMVGMPADLILYGTLMELIARECELEAGEMVYNFGDTHIYNNHLKQAEELLDRCKDPSAYSPSFLSIASDVIQVEDFKPSDLTLIGYHPDERLDFEFNA